MHIENKYKEYLDIKKIPEFFPFKIELYAHFYQNNEKYFASKNVSLWRMTTDEHCFVKSYNYLDFSEIDNMVVALKLGIDHLVKPSSDHMKTFLTGVMIVDSSNLSSELIRYIENFKYCKVFKFYLHGWAEIRLILIDLSSGKVYTNKAGKEVLSFYQKLLED